MRNCVRSSRKEILSITRLYLRCFENLPSLFLLL